MSYSSSSILFSTSHIKVDSKGFEQNLHCHRESEENNRFKIILIMIMMMIMMIELIMMRTTK